MSLQTGQLACDRQVLSSLPVEATTHTLKANQIDPMHSHRRHQVAYSGRSGANLLVGKRRLPIPKERALLIPQGVTHALQAYEFSEVKCVYFHGAVTDSRVRIIALPSLVRELILELSKVDVPCDALPHLSTCLYDQLSRITGAEKVNEKQLSRPLLHVCDTVLHNPSDRSSVDSLARQAGVSSRTLRRLATEELGCTISEFRTKIRMRAGARLLISGLPLSKVAAEVGYESDSAFFSAFKKTFGTTPVTYVKRLVHSGTL